MARRERTVFDGLEPNDALVPRRVQITRDVLDCYDEALANVDDQIAKLVATRAAWIRLIKDARKMLAKQEADGGAGTSAGDGHPSGQARRPRGGKRRDRRQVG